MVMVVVSRMRSVVMMVMVMCRWYDGRNGLALGSVHFVERSRSRADLLICDRNILFLFRTVMMTTYG